jgi:hypothetical protein
MKKWSFILASVALSSGTFAQNPELLSRPQGWAQEDLLIRASGYGGTGISLNGLNLKAPYSAHFNADLPVPIYLLSEPEVWTGLKNSSGYPVGYRNAGALRSGGLVFQCRRGGIYRCRKSAAGGL